MLTSNPTTEEATIAREKAAGTFRPFVPGARRRRPKGFWRSQPVVLPARDDDLPPTIIDEIVEPF